MYFIKKRCGRCLTILRDNGTCPNKKCVRYVPDESKEGVNTQTTSSKETTMNTNGSKSSNG